jgi:uncharacterized protein
LPSAQLARSTPAVEQIMTFGPLQWIFAALGAFMVGVSKSGITGLSILSVALFTHIFPSSKQASGIVLPLLIFGDCVAVLAYRRHTQWRFLSRLFPFTAAGVVLGYFALGAVSDRHARLMIGVIIVALAALSYLRRFRSAQSETQTRHYSWVFAAAVGVTAGFITLIANAAGPLLAIYLVSMRLPKLEYVGTAAVFFMCLNLFKVPFMVSLGLITVHSFGFNLLLAPAVVLGAFAGRWLVIRVNQSLFEKMVLLLSAIGGVLLLL